MPRVGASRRRAARELQLQARESCIILTVFLCTENVYWKDTEGRATKDGGEAVKVFACDI